MMRVRKRMREFREKAMADGEIMKDAGAVANSKGQTVMTGYGRKER